MCVPQIIGTQLVPSDGCALTDLRTLRGILDVWGLPATVELWAESRAGQIRQIVRLRWPSGTRMRFFGLHWPLETVALEEFLAWIGYRNALTGCRRWHPLFAGQDHAPIVSSTTEIQALELVAGEDFGPLHLPQA